MNNSKCVSIAPLLFFVLLLINSSVAQKSNARPYRINFYVHMSKMLGTKSANFGPYELLYKIDRIIVNNSDGSSSGVGTVTPESFIKSNGTIIGEINSGSVIYITVRLKAGGKIEKERELPVDIPPGNGLCERNYYFLADRNYILANEEDYKYYKKNNYNF